MLLRIGKKAGPALGAPLLGAALALGGCGGGASEDQPVLDAGSSASTVATLSERSGATASAFSLSLNPAGVAASYSLAGFIDRGGAFFQSFGTNGRACVSCHQESEGWTITPRNVQLRFLLTGGTDPIFRTNDGSNSPNADVSTVAARRRAYSMLLDKAVIRVGIGIPPNAEFELLAADDPYGYASSSELSLFRRPLPTTNLTFLSTVMWDGRETLRDAGSTDCIAGTTTCFASLPVDLMHQSNVATVTHAQATVPLADAQRQAIVDFETALFTAQIFDFRAGALDAVGARGGPVPLSQESFYFGINDVLVGDYRTRAPFTPTAMTVFDAWRDAGNQGNRGVAAARAAVARGQALFNGKAIAIRGVKGINDDLGIDTLNGTCTTCHDAPNAGDHSIPMPLDIGVAAPERRTADMPLYTLRNLTTGDTVQTTDPGRALITGKWKDIGRFKGPILRAVATRAPYFHNGMAKDLGAVVDFYDTRFGVGFTAQEKADLIAFLQAL